MLTYEKIMAKYDEFNIDEAVLTLLTSTFKSGAHSYKNVSTLLEGKTKAFSHITAAHSYIAVLRGCKIVAVVRVDTFKPYEKYNLYEVLNSCIVSKTKQREVWLLWADDVAHYVQIQYMIGESQHATTCPWTLKHLTDMCREEHAQYRTEFAMSEHKRANDYACV